MNDCSLHNELTRAKKTEQPVETQFIDVTDPQDPFKVPHAPNVGNDSFDDGPVSAHTCQSNCPGPFRTLIESVPEIILRCDSNGALLYANPSFELITGIKASTALGLNLLEIPKFPRRVGYLVHRAKLDVLDNRLPKEVIICWRPARDIARRYYLVRLSPELDSRNRVAGFILTAGDISDIKNSQLQLQRMAFIDPLTNLPNRALFNERLDRMISRRAGNTPSIGGVMLLDLDGFKKVNDVLGHDVGDRLLKETGERIRLCLRQNDTVARLGGDEFALLIPDVRNEMDLAVVARKILNSVKAPFYLSGKELCITTSIGIACHRLDSVNASDLLRFADQAMYHAKASGRGTFKFYSESMNSDALERMELETNLRKALQNSELELFFQPKINVILGQLTGAEALLRWWHPTQGLLTPGTFIGIAEETGLIVAIGDWVLQSTCRVAVECNGIAAYPIRFSVNLSVRQLVTGNFVQRVRRALLENNCQPAWLELEITESLLISSHPSIVKTLESLNEMGIYIALDDFGTGYSSLAYLTRLPIGVIKLDKTFIQDIPARKNSLELVRAVVSIGHGLNIEVVAEGVETIEQVACLDDLGCNTIQGYLYAKPMPLPEFMNWQQEFFRKRNATASVAPTPSPWRDYLITGHEAIDEQHQEIFRQISALSEACRKGEGQHHVAELLVFLGEYIQTHFSVEEELLGVIGFHYFEEHKAAHDDFILMIQDLHSRFIREGASLALTLEINTTTVEWLTRHICVMDRELATRICQFL